MNPTSKSESNHKTDERQAPSAEPKSITSHPRAKDEKSKSESDLGITIRRWPAPLPRPQAGQGLRPVDQGLEGCSVGWSGC
jgi:hypothetical protein